MMHALKSAIVTGAGSGIGRATAVQLAEAGYSIVLVARTESALNQTAEQILRKTNDDRRCAVCPADVSDAASTEQIITTAVQRFGRIDALVNVAGAAPHLPIEEVTEEIWRQCIDTNLSAVVRLTRSAWPVLKRQGSGVIVNVSSLASIDPFPLLAIYAAAKAGLNMFTLCTAREGEAIGVRAVTIAPGAIETPMLRAIFDERTIPRERTLPPEDVAKVIHDCVTGSRNFRSGEVIEVRSP